MKLPVPPRFSDPTLEQHFIRIQQELEQSSSRIWYLDRDVEHPHSLTVRGNLQLSDTTAVTEILDEDNLSSNSATALATQQSIKAYVDSAASLSLDELSDVTLSSVATSDLLRYNGSSWVNATLADAGISATGHTHVIADVTGLQTALDGKASSSHTHAFSEITATPTTLAGYGITDAASSSHTHAFSEITATPTTLAGYGITDAASSSHTHAFSEITATPTTLAGYGITDAASSNHTHALDDLSDVTITTVAAGEVLKWSGSAWVNGSTPSGTVTQVDGTGTVSGLTLTGSVTSSGSLTLGGTLSVNESDIVDGTILARLAANETVSGTYSFSAAPRLNAGLDLQNESSEPSATAGYQMLYSYNNGSTFELRSHDSDNKRRNIPLITGSAANNLLLVSTGTDHDAEWSSGPDSNALTWNGTDLNIAGTGGFTGDGSGLDGVVATDLTIEDVAQNAPSVSMPNGSYQVALADTLAAGDVTMFGGGNQLYYVTTTDTLTGVNASLSGNLTVDTDTLFVDSTNNRVGIGNTNPGAPLSVQSAVDQLADFYSTDTEAYIRIRDNSDSVYVSSDAGVGSLGGNVGSNANNLNINLVSGNVGISTTSPQTALDLGTHGGNNSQLSWHTNSTTSYGSIWTSLSGARLTFGHGVKGSDTVNNGFEYSTSNTWARSALELSYGQINFFCNPADAGTYGNAIAMQNRMTITTTGVGIGTTGPYTKLTVIGTSTTPPISTYNSGLSAEITSYSAQAALELICYQSDGGSPYTKTSALIANSDGTVPSEMQFWTKTNGQSSPSERMRIDASGRVLLNYSTGNNLALTPTRFGYSTSYPVLMLGPSSGSPTVSIGYDPIGNTSGGFSGDGREVLFRNGVEFTTPNASNTTFNRYNLVLKDGYVGIGTASPNTKLEVAGRTISTNVVVGAYATLNDTTGTSQTLQFGNYSAGAFIASSADSYIYKTSSVFAGLSAQTLIFQTRSDTDGGGFAWVAGGTPAVKMYLNSSGNVGIGTASPSYKLHVVGDVVATV